MPNAKNVKLTKFDTKPIWCDIKVMVFLFLQRLYTIIYPLYDGSQSANANQLEVGSWKKILTQLPGG